MHIVDAMTDMKAMALSLKCATSAMIRIVHFILKYKGCTYAVFLIGLLAIKRIFVYNIIETSDRDYRNYFLVQKEKK